MTGTQSLLLFQLLPPGGAWLQKTGHEALASLPGKLKAGKPTPSKPGGSSVSPAPEGGPVLHEVSGFGERRGGNGSCLSKGFSVPWNWTECLLWLFLLPPFFLLTLPIRLYESPDCTGKQQMLTLLL